MADLGRPEPEAGGVGPFVGASAMPSPLASALAQAVLEAFARRRALVANVSAGKEHPRTGAARLRRVSAKLTVIEGGRRSRPDP